MDNYFHLFLKPSLPHLHHLKLFYFFHFFQVSNRHQIHTCYFRIFGNSVNLVIWNFLFSQTFQYILEKEMPVHLMV